MVSQEQKLALLRAIPTFAALDSASLRTLAGVAEAVELADGQVLFRAGEPSDGGYVIVSGALDLLPEHSGGAARQVGPGALVGELALLAQMSRPATARALGPTHLLHLSRSSFVQVLEGAPQAAERLQRAFAGRLNALLGELDNVREGLEQFRPSRHR